MTAHELTRRDFFRMAAGAAAVLPAAAFAGVAGANDRVRVGIVGFSGCARNSLIPALLEHARAMNFEIAAVSDIWNRRRDEAAAFLAQRGCRNVRICRNNDELYSRGGIDAAVIATCDFQHAAHGIEAVRAGCHAYIEPPLAITMDDAAALRAAVRESGRIVQAGTHRRSAADFIAAREGLRSGKLGEVSVVDIACNGAPHGQSRGTAPAQTLREQDTDWRRFLLDRPFEPWDARKYVAHRLYRPYCAGVPSPLLVHQLDTVQWIAGHRHPRSVVASGGVYVMQDGRNTPDTMTAVFDYGPDADPATGFQVLYSSRLATGASTTREHYRSDGAVLDLGRETAGAASAHMRNWMECIRGGRQPNADIEAGYDHSMALCMTVAALQTGKRITPADVTRG